MIDRRKPLAPDDLVWKIHEEVVKRAGHNKHFALAIVPQKRVDWSLRQPAGGRPLLPEVAKAITEVEREFQELYRLKGVPIDKV